MSILLAVIMVVSLFTIVPVTTSAAQVDSYAAVGAGEHFTQDDENTYTIHDAAGWKERRILTR